MDPVSMSQAAGTLCKPMTLELIQCHWENGHGRPWSLCPYGLVHMGGQGTQPQPGLTPYVNNTLLSWPLIMTKSHSTYLSFETSNPESHSQASTQDTAPDGLTCTIHQFIRQALYMEDNTALLCWTVLKDLAWDNQE